MYCLVRATGIEPACPCEHKNLNLARMYAPIITELFDNEEEMAKFQKWREEYEEKERLEKEDKSKKKAGATNVA